jgi:hypothetical protein
MLPKATVTKRSQAITTAGMLFFALILNGCISSRILTPEVARQELRAQTFCGKDGVYIVLKNGAQLGYLTVKKVTDDYIEGLEEKWINGMRRDEYRKISFNDMKSVELRRVPAPMDCLRL